MNFLYIFVLILGVFTNGIFASSGGYSVTPPFLNLEIAKEKESSFSVEIGNNTHEEQIFDLSVVDFGSLDESGGVAFLSKDKYSLASWIRLEKDEVTVAPDKKQKIKVIILNQDSLSSGGHYGAVVATIRNGEKPKKDMVGINLALASLIYVQKSGGVDKNIVLKEVKYNDFWWKFGGNLDLRFENMGNIHLIVRGKVEIVDMFGNIKAKGILNSGSAIILPESIRKYGLKITGLNRWNWPGKYNLKISYRFDGNDDFMVKEKPLYYFGVEGVIISLILIIIIIFLYKKYWPKLRNK